MWLNIVLIVLAVGVGYWLLVGITAVIVWLFTRKRKRRRYNFPTRDLPCVQHEGGTVQLYMRAQDLYADMLADIAEARTCIYFETFAWQDNATGYRFRDALIERAKAGIDVFVIFDWIGTRLAERHKLTFPELPHLHVIRFFSLRRITHLFHLPRWSITHRKLMVVDGTIGYIGGHNIGDRFFHWRDTHARLTGNGVAGLALAFAHLWNSYRHKQRPRLDYPQTDWTAPVRTWFNYPAAFDYPIRSMYFSAIMQAQRSIRLTNAYLLPDRYLQNELLAAAARGVEVSILIPWHSDEVVLDWAVRYAFERYLAGGIRLYGYENMMIHAKTLAVDDDQYGLLGTANLDRLSLRVNHEVNIETTVPEVVAQLTAMFETDLQNARTITLEEWRARPLRMRVGEWILAGLWPFL